MPIGTTAVSAKNLPSEPYVITAQAWAQTAKRNEDVITTSQAGPGTPFNFTLPQVGIAAELVITLTATLVIEADHAATTGIRWPYGLLSTFSLGVNGQQNLFDVVGEDLKVRQDIAFPAYTEDVDIFPSVIGGGASTDLTAGTHKLSLSWRVPISTELVTLSGGLYAQSPSTTIRCVCSVAALATVIHNTPQYASLTNVNWSVSETFFVPSYSTKGEIIVPPGISTLHAMTSIDLPLFAGQNPLSLVRGSGNLQRLFMSFFENNLRISAAPSVTPSYRVQELILSYAQKQQPYIWTPASVLLRRNNLDYGETPPYDYLVFDTLKQTPQRDAVYYPGLTELKVLAFIGSDVDSATAHLVQEDLFQ